MQDSGEQIEANGKTLGHAMRRLKLSKCFHGTPAKRLTGLTVPHARSYSSAASAKALDVLITLTVAVLAVAHAACPLASQYGTSI